MSERISQAKKSFLSLPEVKRIQELEHYIDGNSEIQTAFRELKNKQKQMVSAKEFHQTKQYEVYAAEYEALKANLLDMPFVEEYLELLEIVDAMLQAFALEVEQGINRAVNG